MAKQNPILEALNRADQRNEEIRRRSIRTAVSNIAESIAKTTELVNMELDSLIEEKFVERARNRAKLLAEGV